MDVAGTELYFLPATGTPVAATKVACDVSNVTMDADTIDSKEGQCISVVGTQEAVPGARHAGTTSISINLEVGDASHQALEALADGKPPPTVWWAIGDSDSPGTAPALVTDSGTPATYSLGPDSEGKRSWRIFRGYISSYQVTYAFGEQVAVAITVQRSGDVTRVYAS